MPKAQFKYDGLRLGLDWNFFNPGIEKDDFGLKFFNPDWNSGLGLKSLNSDWKSQIRIEKYHLGLKFQSWIEKAQTGLKQDWKDFNPISILGFKLYRKFSIHLFCRIQNFYNDFFLDYWHLWGRGSWWKTKICS